MQPLTDLALGWTRDRPDFRDYTPDHSAVSAKWTRLPRARHSLGPPMQVDLREYFLPGIDRGLLPLPTACACAMLAEYFERRAHGKAIACSALFLYQTAYRLSQPFGDPGTNIRTTLKALAHFGVPPEDHYPSEENRLGTPPDAFVGGLARRFSPVLYIRIDSRNTPGEKTLEKVRAFLASGFPLVFGFSMPASAVVEKELADIPYRVATDTLRGGQAALAVGYDDRRLTATRGALLVYTPLAPAWGRAGYYWLPYRFIEEQLAVDFWTILRDDWIDSEEFNRPGNAALRP